MGVMIDIISDSKPIPRILGVHFGLTTAAGGRPPTRGRPPWFSVTRVPVTWVPVTRGSTTGVPVTGVPVTVGVVCVTMDVWCVIRGSCTSTTRDIDICDIIAGGAAEGVAGGDGVAVVSSTVRKGSIFVQGSAPV